MAHDLDPATLRWVEDELVSEAAWREGLPRKDWTHPPLAALFLRAKARWLRARATREERRALK